MNKTGVTQALTAAVNRGFLVPEWYHDEHPDATGLRIVYLVGGITLPVAVFIFAKAFRHSLDSYRHRKLLNAYILMVWAVWTTSVGIGIVSFLFLQGIIPARLAAADGPTRSWRTLANAAEVVIMWLVQMQCILQIIANRLAVLLPSRRDERNLKLGIFLFMTLLLVSVSIVWMPARLQISPRVMLVNDIWDRASKALFLGVDLSLNFYFLQHVHRRLISNGLFQFRVLFRVNVVMICIGVIMDAGLIGFMSLNTGIIYMQFNPLVFLIKLYIELNLAELIARIVRTTHLPSAPSPPPPATAAPAGPEVLWGTKLETCIQGGRRSCGSVEHGDRCGARSTSLDPPQSGIMKTVELQVMIQRRTSEMLIDPVGYESDK